MFSIMYSQLHWKQDPNIQLQYTKEPYAQVSQSHDFPSKRDYIPYIIIYGSKQILKI